MSTLFVDIDEALSFAGFQEKDGRHPKLEDLRSIPKAAIFVEQGKIKWIGPQKKIPKILSKNKKIKELSLHQKKVLPAFVECHTHTIFAGTRSQEFELRNQGMSYQEIAAKGGGILSTMNHTRKASFTDLKKMTQLRCDRFLSQGVGTLEIKTGYGLSLKDEIKCLSVIKELKGPEIISCFLGAHAKPPEFQSYDMYLKYLVESVLPQVKKKKLSERVDIFIEKGFFEKPGAYSYLEKAKEMGFAITVHADQLSLSGGSLAAVELSALSADHVIKVEDKEIQAIANSHTVAVLLPAADLYLRCSYPPARKLIEAGACVALATDFNPGSSPTQDLNLVGLLARLEMKMSLPEVFSAYTYGAAKALGVHDRKGVLVSGYDADFICIDSECSDLFYSIGSRNIDKVVLRGKIAK